MITGGEQVTSKQMRERRQQDLEGKKGSRVFEHVWRDSKNKPLGLELTPVQLAMETMPGKFQTFWSAVVTKNTSGIERILVGDVVLFINTAMCIIDKSQARYGGEYVRAIVDAIKACNDPRALRFCRLDTVDEDEDDGLQRFYQLSRPESLMVYELISREGDNPT